MAGGLSWPRIVGIVNITADSFSDGGRYLDPDNALAHARRLRSQGADVIELGPASSHPDAATVTAAEEGRRLAPVLSGLAADRIAVSVDSTCPRTQRLALDHGVAYLNDIRGFPDPDMYPALAASDCHLIVMHSIHRRGVATRVHTDPGTIWARIEWFLADRLATLRAAGISRERLIVDPGLGFFLGANPEPSAVVLGGIDRLRARFGVRVLVSPSRKSFLRALTTRDIPDTGPATLAAELYAASAGVDYIRTHDVQALHDALTVLDALHAHQCPPTETDLTAMHPVDLLREWYAQINDGDLAGAVAKLHPEIEWAEAEHSPYGWPGPPLVGFAAINHAVWSKLALDWADIRVVPDEFVAAPDTIAVLGRYLGRHARSGAELDAQFVHVWTIAAGQIIRYRGFADTYALHNTINTDVVGDR